jgi:hypothetical protein
VIDGAGVGSMSAGLLRKDLGKIVLLLVATSYHSAKHTCIGRVVACSDQHRPIAFFSRKPFKTQQKYSVTEIELLAIVETLNEFKGMLWGQDIKVYTDHKHLTRDALGLTSERVYCWRLLLEEYAPELIYIKGIHNTVADAISRLEYDPKLNKTNEYTHAMLGVEPGRGIERKEMEIFCAPLA